MLDREGINAMMPVIQVLEQLDVPYYVCGSTASSLHGMVRTTMDVDLVAQLAARHAAPFVKALENAYYVNKEMVQDAIDHHSSFNVLHLETMFKVDVFVQKTQAYDQVAMQRRSPFQIAEPESLTFFIAAPEDTIISKLDWYRKGGEVSEKQWNDILGVLRVQQGTLDMDYLHHWAVKLSLEALLNEAIQNALRAEEG